MPSVFEELSARFQDEPPSGLSAVDLADLPSDQKLIMLTLLRDSSSGFEGIAEDVLRGKLSDRVSNFDETVAYLVGLGWLIPLGEAASLHYRLNLRAKRGSASTFNMWTILTDRLPVDWKGAIKPDAT